MTTGAGTDGVLDRGAVASLLLGVISFACGITAPLAIWLGYRSLRRIARSDGRLKGRGAAAGAVVMGATSAAFAVGGIAYWWLAS